MSHFSEASEARNRLPFETDLEMWHKFVGFAGWLILVANDAERTMYQKCAYYSYDQDAFEEYCCCPEINRTNDFNADDECWKCKLFRPRSNFTEEYAKGHDKGFGHCLSSILRCLRDDLDLSEDEILAVKSAVLERRVEK